MNKEITKHRFEEEKKSLIQFHERTKRIIPVNQYLNKFNWAFVHPYMIGAEIDHFAELAKTKTGTKDGIFQFIANSFFDLSSTAVLIDGFFKKRESLRPFCHLIDQSVFMCLERDYAGAINSLLPVIEGSIRHYLVNMVGRKNESIMKTEELLKIFPHLKQDILKRYANGYKNEYPKYFTGVAFDASQIKHLVKLQSYPLDIWISVIKDYFENNLYLDTRTGVVEDKLNRHSIFHGFSGEIYYNLENYLKVFYCINFLSYIYGQADKNIHALTELERSDVDYKWKAFEKVKAISDSMKNIKSSVYEKYSEFNRKEFEKDLIRTKMDRAVAKFPHMESKLKFIDNIIDLANESDKKRRKK